MIMSCTTCINIILMCYCTVSNYLEQFVGARQGRVRGRGRPLKREVIL